MVIFMYMVVERRKEAKITWKPHLAMTFNYLNNNGQ